MTENRLNIPDRPECKWATAENQERLMRMIARGYFSAYNWLTYMQPLREDKGIFRNEVKRCWNRCAHWCSRYENGVIMDFPTVDAGEMFLDMDDAFRTKPVSAESPVSVREHVENLQAMWYNDLGKSVKSPILGILAYGEAVGLHIMICAIFNGAEIGLHPELNSFNRYGSPASPFDFNLGRIRQEDIAPNTVCTFLHVHEKLLRALYRQAGHDRDAVFRSFSPSFVESVDRVLCTLVDLYSRSDVFALKWDKYRREVSARRLTRECIDRTRRCGAGRVW